MVKRTPRIISRIAQLDPQQWQALDHQHNPFLNHAFLHALEASGSVCAETGWQPHHLCLFEGDELVACAPSYLKTHSHGEFVFDWAWADAYQRHGRHYYPKLLTAVPYSPVPGPRLLVRRGRGDTGALQAELAELAMQQCEELDLSSWHCNFIGPGHEAYTRQQSLPEPLLARCDWQFHWFNQGYQSFAEFLAGLRSKKRKNLRRDRRQVAQAGVGFRQLRGDELSAAELQFVFSCYQQTFLEHGNHPALNPAFFRQLVDAMPGHVLVVIASRDGRDIAMSFYLQGGGRLYGRYWGSLEQIPGLHFETAYHQGIEYCIRHGLQVFEPGAQGEHKISRGFTPVRTHSVHLVRDPVFRRAIADFLQRERQWLDDYREELDNHLPFRQTVQVDELV